MSTASFGGSFNENAFRKRVDACLKRVSLILEANRVLGTPDEVSHKYEDKYLLAVQLTNMTCASVLNCLAGIGVTMEHLKQLHAWSTERDVSLCMESTEKCKFVREQEREVEDINRQTQVSSGGLPAVTFTSKVITKVKEYVFEYSVAYSLVGYRGTGSFPEDRLELCSRNAQQTVITRSKTAPYPMARTASEDLNVSWIVRNLDEAMCPAFGIDRTQSDCHTPGQNRDVGAAMKFFRELREWSEKVSTYFSNELISVMNNNSLPTGGTVKHNLSAINAVGVFVPVIPLFDDIEGELGAPAAAGPPNALIGGESTKCEDDMLFLNRKDVPVELGDDGFRFYCGEYLGTDIVPGADGLCGPRDGVQCRDCAG
jgi:hypothetical protein